MPTQRRCDTSVSRHSDFSVQIKLQVDTFKGHETFEPLSNTWLTLIEIINQISIRRMRENFDETRTCYSAWYLTSLFRITILRTPVCRIYRVNNAIKTRTILAVPKNLKCEKYWLSNGQILLNKMSNNRSFSISDFLSTNLSHFESPKFF